jgi:flagellar biosynthesis GTPase FlhF
MEAWEAEVMTLFTIKKIWLWLKHNWVVVALVLYTAVMWFVFRRNADAALEVLAAKKKSYDDQIKILKQNHHDEILKKNQLIETYQKVIDEIEKKFEEQQRSLKEEEKERVKEIIVTSKRKPDVIKQEIEEALGFTFITPIDP